MMVQPKGQAKDILEYLENGNTITPLESINRFGCYRLGARIFDLREMGYDVKTKMISVGKNKNVAQYYMEVNNEEEIKDEDCLQERHDGQILFKGFC